MIRRGRPENFLRRPFVVRPPGVSDDVRNRELVRDGRRFDVWRETYDLGGRAMSRRPRDRFMVIEHAYTKDGHYIGSPENARYLCEVKGIAPELSDPTNNVCSIGLSSIDGKWYGWSHRAISGFGTREQAARFAGEVS